MTQKFEIIKGTEKDFEGAPEDVLVLASLSNLPPDFATGIGYGEFFYDDLSGERIEMRSPQAWTLIAERRPITEPQSDDEGWIEWKGGKKAPVRESDFVTVRYRDGSERTENGWSGAYWQHHLSDSDIIAYRLSKPEQVKQPESPVTWDGNGLPPVGVECEFSTYKELHWRNGKVMYLSEYSVVMSLEKIEDGKHEFISHPRTLRFRPLRSPESIEREKSIQEMKSILEQKCGTLGLCGLALAEAIYDAGYRKVGK